MSRPLGRLYRLWLALKRDRRCALDEKAVAIEREYERLIGERAEDEVGVPASFWVYWWPRLSTGERTVMGALIGLRPSGKCWTLANKAKWESNFEWRRGLIL